MRRPTPSFPFWPLLLLLLFAVVPWPAPDAAAQQGPPPAVRAAISGVLEMLDSEGEEALATFAETALAESFRDRLGAGELLAHLGEVRAAAAGRTGDVAVEKGPGEELTLVLEGGVRLLLALDDEAKVTRLELLSAGGGEVGGAPGGAGAAATAGDELTWETLDARFKAAVAEQGFSGVVLARRGGETVLHRAYGAADRGSGRRNRLDTVFGIGSTPIDFTITLAALLAERGDLDLDQPVGRHLGAVPDDKRELTPRMILDGRSGLPDFHDTEADWDPDLGWIDRDTAVERILAQPLLFAPGQGEAHSHSAYVLLSAVLEHATGRSYRELVESEILGPLGMERSGFYGETRGLGLEDFAVGYGASSAGLPNIPPNWGPTSWLVMGSGGMYSTLGDLTRYHDALAAGRPVGGPWARRQLAGVFVGGSDRGYFYFRAADREGDSLTLLMNGEGRDPQVRALTGQIMRLVMDEE